MNNDDQFISCSDMIMNTFSNIEKSSVEKSNKLSSTWKNVITKVSRCGQNLYEHTTLVDLKNGILLIEADHPGWIQMLQMNSKFVIKGLKMSVPELQISSLAFRLKGSSASLHKVDYESQIVKERKKMGERYEKEEEEFQKYEKNSEKESDSVELPPELKLKFESLKKSMLTKK